VSFPSALERALGRPEPFEPHDAPFWNDPYIGAQMLAAHLDPGTDAASRRPATIERQVDQLIGALGLRRGDRLLDLGCGPGLYAEAFARRGISVCGIDFSPVAIGHARASARASGLEIEYRLGDYTTDELGRPYEAAAMIYLDFGVLADAPRDRLLAAVAEALIPGGAFAFDVNAPGWARVRDGGITVTRHEHGFWRPEPHLVVETTYRYGSHLDLTQYAVIDADGQITTYRVWDRAYSVTELRRLLSRHGLQVESIWSDLDRQPWRRSSDVVAVVARRTGQRLRRRRS
jgi:SAM-dependent methyltransferase